MARILTVEDDNVARRVLVIALESDGHEVLEAADGASGLEAARTELPDAILLDIGLPDIHGSVVLEELKSDPATAAIPVLVVSAWGEEKMATIAREHGAWDVLRKPFEIAVLLDRVNAAVAGDPSPRV